ncbi:MAG TPA: hypothetical protein VN436_09335 [Holophaga sp.]|nr:hypothetical protein [Holophaga sp.]
MFFWILMGAALAAVGWSSRRDRQRTRAALKAALRSWLSLLPSLMALTAGIGLALAWLPPAKVAQLFRFHGTAGFFLLAAVGSLLTIPAPVAYPLAGTLHRMGASLPALAAFITTLTMVGVLTAPLEVQAFGRRFTLLRQSLSLVLALVVGALMGVLL